MLNEECKAKKKKKKESVRDEKNRPHRCANREEAKIMSKERNGEN
jgi:hypothetical protein